jgi:hypothetical protein
MSMKNITMGDDLLKLDWEISLIKMRAGLRPSNPLHLPPDEASARVATLQRAFDEKRRTR